jgi:hypothetical protein
MRQSPWRPIALAVALIIAGTWAVGAGWYVSEAWPVRAAMARVELAREQNACGNRSASSQQGCRELAEIMSRAVQAQSYFVDGAVVFGPAVLLLGFAWWLRRSQRRPRNGPHHPHHHHTPSATA